MAINPATLHKEAQLTSSTQTISRKGGGMQGRVKITQAQYDKLCQQRERAEDSLSQKKKEMKAYAPNAEKTFAEGADTTLVRLKRDVDALDVEVTRLTQEIEDAEIITNGHGGDVVEVGSQVTIKFISKTGKPEYTFLISSNGDLGLDVIGEGCPLAQALLGQREGDEVSYSVRQTGGSEIEQTVKILQIE